MEDLRENCSFESFGRIPGKQRQAISVSSLLLSFLSLSLYYDIFPYFLWLPYASLFFLLGVSLFSIAFWPFFVSFASSLAAPCLARGCAAMQELHTQGT
jgi:hypothetical protein